MSDPRESLSFAATVIELRRLWHARPRTPEHDRLVALGVAISEHLIPDDSAHAAALSEVDRLWNAPPETPDEDRLLVLAVAISAYEDKRWPIDLKADEDP